MTVNLRIEHQGGDYTVVVSRENRQGEPQPQKLCTLNKGEFQTVSVWKETQLIIREVDNG
jgi:hypothetical protein